MLLLYESRISPYHVSCSRVSEQSSFSPAFSQHSTQHHSTTRDTIQPSTSGTSQPSTSGTSQPSTSGTFNQASRASVNQAPRASVNQAPRAQSTQHLGHYSTKHFRHHSMKHLRPANIISVNIRLSKHRFTFQQSKLHSTQTRA